MQKIVFIIALISFSCQNTPEQESNLEATPSLIEEHSPKDTILTVNFRSTDDLVITADLYQGQKGQPYLLLCHQAGFSRGEYIETAPWLVSHGYNCMAIDQRSGEKANNIKNTTAVLAREKGLPLDYNSARPDIEAAIDYLYELSGGVPIILVGSSYSASLALIIACKNSKVRAAASFSPGEYLQGISVSSSLKGCTKPVFVTSSKKEFDQTLKVIGEMETKYVHHFKPVVNGIHGSRALWAATPGHESYREAFLTFLNSNQ